MWDSRNSLGTSEELPGPDHCLSKMGPLLRLIITGVSRKQVAWPYTIGVPVLENPSGAPQAEDPLPGLRRGYVPRDPATAPS